MTRHLAPYLAAGAAAAAALAVARATPADEAARLPPRATLARDVPGPARSALPTAEEWLGATQVKLTRTSPRAAACAASRVREWLRVRCATPTFAISLLGGETDGLSFWIGGEAEGRFGEVQLPLRRGDRRVVQLWATRDSGGGSAAVVPALVLQEVWVEDDAAPTVTVL
jgi:hypothetical protein